MYKMCIGMISVLEKQRQEENPKLEACLIYMEVSKPAKTA